MARITNLAKYPGCANGTAAGGWPGPEPATSVATIETVDWTVSGTAFQAVWTTDGSGEYGPRIDSTATDVLTEGSTYTIEYDVLLNRDGTLSEQSFGGSSGSTFAMVANSGNVGVSAGVPTHRWATFVCGSGTDARVANPIKDNQWFAGDSIQIGNILIYPGAYQNIDYFDGDSGPFRYGPTAQLVIPKWSGTPGESSSYFDYEEPWIPNTTWDTMPDRVYELGTDRGMFYPQDSDGVPWNGLISVKEKLDENSPTMYYIDGVRYYADTPAGEFQASLEAFTYPEEFINYSGYFEETDDVPGLYYDEQATKTFGLSYRTKVGDGQYGPDIFYKIHLVYNVIAVVTDRDYTTINGSPEASTFTWDLYTIPAESSVAPISTAHLIIDSRKIPGPKLKALEDLLYGDGVNPPELPSPDDVRAVLS